MSRNRGSGSAPQVGMQPLPLSSVLYGIIYKRRSVLAAQVLLREKSGAQRVGPDSIIPGLPETHMVEAERSTILSILVGIVHLLSAICFCISSYVYQQLHSRDCQHFVHYSSQ